MPNGPAIDEDALNAQIDDFFLPPNAEPAPAGERVSTLYLLRREIQDCMIGAVVPEEEVRLQPTRHRIFASLMVMCSGIDLLGRFAARPAARSARERFVDFLETFAGLDREHGEMVLAYRNALMHSFGLYHEGRDGKHVPLVIFQTDVSLELLTQENGEWALDFDHLYGLIRLAIRNYRRALADRQDLRQRFATLYPRLGVLHVVAERPVGHRVRKQ